MHGPYCKVIELLCDLFGLSLSVGAIHAWVVEAAQRAAKINRGAGSVAGSWRPVPQEPREAGDDQRSEESRQTCAD